MTCFPVFVDLSGRLVLIAGGGKVALRKLEKLREYGAVCHVVAPAVDEAVRKMPGVTVTERSFRPSDLLPRPELVIAATNDRSVNREISDLCRIRHIPVNVVDDPELCTFFFPALVRQGRLSVGISTGGASPAAGAYLREAVAEVLPEAMDEILDYLADRRPEIRCFADNGTERAAVSRALLEACLDKGGPLSEEETAAIYEAVRRDAAAPAADDNDSTEKRVGSVMLVGAGCGRADLCTVRGQRYLRTCTALVYDDLIDPALIAMAPEQAERHYVGKREGCHAASQETINQLLIELAKAGHKVVRLKGGDPFIFGRGGEELAALSSAGIRAGVVPGITSAAAIPAEAGIPVTYRGISRGVHIMTAHTADTPDGLPEDLDTLAALEGTLVFLMGLRALPVLAERLMAAGKPAETPAAVISGGNAGKTQAVRGTLGTITAETAVSGIRAPAVIVVGDVAAMDLFKGQAGDLFANEARKRGLSSVVEGSHPSANCLAGIRVGVTGTEGTARTQCRLLESMGAETRRLAVLKVRNLPMNPFWETRHPHWLVFTSANGVRSFFRQLKREGRSLQNVEGRHFAVIGEATGRALMACGIRADVMPPVYTSEALALTLAEKARPRDEIILLRSAKGSPVLRDILEERGFTVRDIAVYDTVPEETKTSAEDLDYLTFASAGGVELFFRQYGCLPEGVRCVCIGEVTACALERCTEASYLIADEISAEGLVNAVVRDVRRSKAAGGVGDDR